MAPSSIVINNSCSRASRKDEFAIERLGEACIGDSRRNAVRRERFRRLRAFRKPRAQREQGDRAALRDNAAFPDFERHTDLGHRRRQRHRPVDSERAEGRSSIAAAVATM